MLLPDRWGLFPRTVGSAVVEVVDAGARHEEGSRRAAEWGDIQGYPGAEEDGRFGEAGGERVPGVDTGGVITGEAGVKFLIGYSRRVVEQMQAPDEAVLGVVEHKPAVDYSAGVFKEGRSSQRDVNPVASRGDDEGDSEASIDCLGLIELADSGIAVCPQCSSFLRHVDSLLFRVGCTRRVCPAREGLYA